MEENNIPQEGSSIDFMKIFKDLLKYKKLYLKVLGVAAVVAVIYTLSLPNYYKVTVKLSPELNSRRSSNSLSSMASMFGINLSGAAGNTTEALFPTLYPDLMNSVTFHSSLFSIKIHRDKDDKMMTYYDYLLNEQKSPWWSQAIGATKGAVVVAGHWCYEGCHLQSFHFREEETGGDRGKSFPLDQEADGYR